jgi:hypothetical protein
MLDLKIEIGLPVDARRGDNDVCMRRVTVTIQTAVRSHKRESNLIYGGPDQMGMLDAALQQVRDHLGAVIRDGERK